jgi:predicted GNAT superfamily acetyltransferase
VSVNIETGLADLEQGKVGGIEMIMRLSKYKVNYYDVTYEGINHGETKDRLTYIQAMADFIRPGVVVNESVLATKIAFIGHYHQVEEVTNYADLQRVLRGTRFSQYFH